MKIKKFIILLISLIMISNILIPTIVLAVEETEKNTENNIGVEDTEVVEDIEEDEETTTENENSESAEQDNADNSSIEENFIENETSIQKQMTNRTVQEELKGMLYIDAPTNGNTYYSSENQSISVYGWKMANVSDTYVKVYIDGTQINADEISYIQRQDVINSITGYGTPEQNPTPGFSLDINTTNLETGSHTIRVELCSGETVLQAENININYYKDLHVQYRTHVENIGWQDYVEDGELAGTEGKALPLEAIDIKLLNNSEENLNIKYQVHVENIGWQDWKQNGEMAGTEGEALQLEAIRINLEETEDYSIMYRVHIENIGWQDWKTDGEMAGTEGKALQLEAIEIKIVEKQSKSMLYVDTPTNGRTYYSSENQTINVSGWKMANVSNTYIRAYIDGSIINADTINYTQRQDVINSITGYGTQEQNPTPGFNFDINIANLENGSHEIKIELCTNSKVLQTQTISINVDKEMHVQYRTHVENIGWQDWKTDGEMAGTQGQVLQLEALDIKLLNNAEENLNIKYQVHVENIGWQDWKQNGEMAGTEGKALQLEAIRISLEDTDNYSIMYRVHIENIGWQDWKTDGEMAGTEGKALQLEAIEIKIVEKQKKSMLYIDNPTNGSTYYSLETQSINVSGWKMANVSDTYIRAYIDDKEIDKKSITYTQRQDVINSITDYGTAEQNPTPGFNFNIDTANLEGGNHIIKIEIWHADEILETGYTSVYIDTNIHIKYSAHVSEIGWQDYILDGKTAGTEGQSLQVEALRIELVNAPETAHVKYKAYVEGTGWTDYLQDGEQAGTTGENKKIQAIQIEVEGLEGYVVEYQAHVQNIGWQVWAADGMEAGVTYRSLSIEALKVRIVEEKNSVVPQVKYSVHNETNGWSSYGKNGATLGDTANSLKLDAIKIALENSGTASIKYRVHVQEVGWMDEVQNDEQAGTATSVCGIEAIEMELEGLDGYSIEYRTYIIGEGWQDWVRDGITSGTTGENLQISAIQIRIAIKRDNSSLSNFQDIDETKYPGYKQKLEELQNKHPNWIITLDYTGLDWNTVIANEDTLVTDNDGSISAKSLTQYTNEWRTSDTTQYETGWYRASRAAIEYMMDPRNSLDEIYVFQFQDLTSSAGTHDDIANMISGTFLTRYENYSTDSIINAILSAAETYNVSPYHLVSRIIQEQGTDGGSLNGYVYNGVTVYNLFNIGAYNTETANSIQNGAAYAYQQRWFTPETCIIGSARFLNNGYLARGQTTLYYQKYNVVAEPYYTNQYMTNIRAANDEGERIAKEYKENGLINGEFEFTIPVYENMPATACPRPSGSLY